MGLRQGAFAKVWKMENKGKYTVAEMSTSKKNKETGKYDTDWSSKFVKLIGTAHNQAQQLKEGDSVKIDAFEVTSNYDKEKKIMYTNFAIFSFSDLDSNVVNNPRQTQNNSQLSSFDDEDDLPF